MDAFLSQTPRHPGCDSYDDGRLVFFSATTAGSCALIRARMKTFLLGHFGWYGAATTCCQIDPKERLVAIALAQHFPFNQHSFFAAFQTGYYQAMK